MVGLATSTLSNYCKRGRSTLVRGQDFFVWRPNCARRYLMFTERGVARLLARDYRITFRGQGGQAQIPRALERAKRDPMTYRAVERRMWLKALIALAGDAYLQHGGCAVPNCPCVIHQHPLNIPQADYIRAVMEIRPGEYPVRERRRPPMGGTPPAPRNAT